MGQSDGGGRGDTYDFGGLRENPTVKRLKASCSCDDFNSISSTLLKTVSTVVENISFQTLSLPCCPVNVNIIRCFNDMRTTNINVCLMSHNAVDHKTTGPR